MLKKKKLLFTFLSLPLLAGMGINTAHALPHASRAAHHSIHHVHTAHSSVLPAVASGAIAGAVVAHASHANENSVGHTPLTVNTATNELYITCGLYDRNIGEEVDFAESLKYCKDVLNTLIPNAQLGDIVNIYRANNSTDVTYKVIKPESK